MALGYSAPNSSDYQDFFLRWRGCSNWCAGLTTLPLACARCLEIWEPEPRGTLRACLGLYKGSLYLLYYEEFLTLGAYILQRLYGDAA
jgi:hypothetical protein